MHFDFLKTLEVPPFFDVLYKITQVQTDLRRHANGIRFRNEKKITK